MRAYSTQHSSDKHVGLEGFAKGTIADLLSDKAPGWAAAAIPGQAVVVPRAGTRACEPHLTSSGFGGPAAAADGSGLGARTSRRNAGVAPLALADCCLGAVALSSLGVKEQVGYRSGRVAGHVEPDTTRQW